MLNRLVKEEGLSVTDEDVEQHINQLAEMHLGRAAEARTTYSSDENRRLIRFDLLSSAGLARAVAIAKGVAPAKPEAAPAEGPVATL